jgi:hypothetical protein
MKFHPKLKPQFFGQDIFGIQVNMKRGNKHFAAPRLLIRMPGFAWVHHDPIHDPTELSRLDPT